MSGEQQTHDPAKVTLIFGGTQIKQFAKGTMIKVAYDEEQFTDAVGGDGRVVRMRNANRAGKIEFTLMAASPSNDYLSDKAAADFLDGTGVNEVQVKDGTGTSKAHDGNAWLTKTADVEHSSEPGMERAWTIRCPHLESFVGGTTALG